MWLIWRRLLPWEKEKEEGWGERGQGRRGGEERREAKRSPKPPSCHGDSLSERSSQSWCCSLLVECLHVGNPGSHALGHIGRISAFERQGHEDKKSRVILGYIASARPAWANDTLPRPQKRKLSFSLTCCPFTAVLKEEHCSPSPGKTILTFIP